VAVSYVTAGSYQTVRVLSQTQVVEVEAIGIYTQPSGFYVVVQVPLAEWQAGGADTYLATTADLIEGVVLATPDPGQTLAAGVAYVQDVDASGLLSAFLDFTVSYTPKGAGKAPFTTVVQLPMTSFETADAFNTALPGGTPLAQLEAAYSRLKATANL
jgi:hypothetical protein